MLYHRILNGYANGSLCGENRVRRLGGKWFVTDVENPGEFLHGPMFDTKREAVKYADENLRAVLNRLREEMRTA